MSTTLPPPEMETVRQPVQLSEHLPEWLRWPRVVAGLTALVGIIFWGYCYEPLYHTDLWGHLAYGRLIVETGAIPATEPFMKLAAGVRLVDTAWLSQVIGYLAESHWGPAGVQFLHAVVIGSCCLLLTWNVYRRTWNATLTTAAVLLFCFLNWHQFVVVRPQMAGLLCYVGLLAVAASRRWRAVNWALVPLLFLAWANLHGSFVVGLFVLGCFTAGRAFDVFRRNYRVSAVFHDRIVRRLFLLTELCAAATLINPYGWRLYVEVLTFSGNPNLRDLYEWDALLIRSPQGLATLASVVALAFVYRLSPRRVLSGEALALLALGGMAFWSARMLIWWTPLAAGCFAWHAHAAWRRFHPLPFGPVPSPRSGRWTVVTLGLVWVCFGFTPFGLKMLHGRSIELKNSVSPQTPVAAVEYLKEHPPVGQVFNTYELGDFLLWNGPPGVEVYLTSQAHLVPREVWRDYLGTIGLASGWEDNLDRYGVNTVLLDKPDRAALISRLKDDERWTRSFEDEAAVVFTRKKPL
jgi:hypothetical protein